MVPADRMRGTCAGEHRADTVAAGTEPAPRAAGAQRRTADSDDSGENEAGGRSGDDGDHDDDHNDNGDGDGDGRGGDGRGGDGRENNASDGVATPVGEAAPSTAPVVPADTWYRLGAGMETNVSGVALVQTGASQITALIARDNKQAGENRLSTVTFVDGRAPVVTPVEWHGDLPADIEGIDAVPGRPGRFVTLTSAGEGQMITVGASGVTVDGTFVVPEPVSDPKYEGFALAALAGRTVAVWADRGQDDSPATVFAALFDVGTRRFGTPVRMKVTAPYPLQDARDVSDVKIVSGGTLLVTSASEGGDDGPFDGAVYAAGTVAATAGGVTLTPAADPRPLLKLAGRKAEAIACAPSTTTCVLGADNENKGGSLRMVTILGPEPRAAR